MKYIQKYKHAFILPIYAIFYMVCFHYLETTVTTNYHNIYIWIDDVIPFCEYFIIPYLLWFFYVAVVLVYITITDKSLYWKFAMFLFLGMTVFLIVSWVYPNGQQLRPEVFPRENIFTDMVRSLYKTDTPTNILPSIHVYNSIGTHIAVTKSKSLSKKKGIVCGSFILMVLIILSTVFLKQHSMVDVITGILMAEIFYILVYKIDYRVMFKRPSSKREV